MRTHWLAALALVASGCANSPSKDYYLACLDSGASEPTCRMRAAELRQGERSRLSRLGSALSAAGAGMRRAEAQVPRSTLRPPAPPRGISMTNCDGKTDSYGHTSLNCSSF